MSHAADVIVVGGGIVGAACAWECARAGLRVTVVERQREPGLGATAAGMGHLVVMDGSEAEFALTRYSLQLWDGLAARLPSDCEYHACGTIWIAADACELDEVERKARYYRQRGAAVEMLDARALYACEPHLRPGLCGALRVPGDAIVYAPRVAAFLLEEAAALGARLTLGHGASALVENGVRLVNGAVLQATAVIVATGVAAPELVTGLPVHPRKGQLVITQRYPALIRHQLLELGYLKSVHGSERDSVACNVQPRPTGQILIGSSRQLDVADDAVEPELLRRMLVRAAEYVPALGDLQALRVWTGHRAATPDGLPYIGPWGALRGVLLATGHEGLGITTSLATARLLVDRLLERRSAIDGAPYLPSRLAAGATVHA